MAFYSIPKRRDYVLNPRGKALYDDTDRFGTKMLEKMGWSKGKGLGTKLEGNLDFIKVSHKSDQKGIGFADRDDQWTQHEANFNSLLKSFDTSVDADSSSSTSKQKDNTTITPAIVYDEKSLNEQVPVFSGVSLEEQSKKSRARVHYKKFTRGKDMARYSEKDLANIFGKKSLNERPVVELNEIKLVDDAEDKDEKKTDEPVVDNNFGITVIETGTSINDYFKAKMEEMRLRKYGVGNGGNPFGTSKMTTITTDNEGDASDVVINVSSKSNDLKVKKKKNKKIDNSAEETNEGNLLLPPQSKKKRKNNPENDEKTHRSPSPSIVTTKKSKKKNKKDKILENIQNNTTEKLNMYVCGQIEDFIVEKKKNIIDNENEIFEIPNDTTTTTLIDNEIKSKQKKGGDKKTKINELEIENDVGKQKKSKKEKLKKQIISDNVVEAVTESCSGVNEVLKRKKQTKNKEVNQQIHFPKVISNLLNHVYAPCIEYSITDSAFYVNTNLEPATTQTNTNKSTTSNLKIPDTATFEIAKFKADIFRFYDLNGFVGSNLSNISGYGFDKNVQIKIISSHKDEVQFNRFWDDLIDNKYGAAFAAKSSKEKYKLKKKKLLKKNVFKI